MRPEERKSYDDFLLDPCQVALYRTGRGSLMVRIGAEEYQDLGIRRAFPLEDPGHFISFFLNDGTELGMVEDLEKLDAQSHQVLLEELDKIYFHPIILRFNTIDEEFGIVQADVQTSRGPRHLEIRNIRVNIRLLSGDRALIEDVDGNYYELRQCSQLPRLVSQILGF